MRKLFVCLVAIISLAALPVHSETTVSTFTGGDAGEGLDLDGTYIYMVDLGGSASSRNIQGYIFTTAASAGVTVTLTGGAANGNWETRQGRRI